MKTLATTMLLYERLVCCGTAGRAASLRSASSCVSPAGAAVVVTPSVSHRTAFRPAPWRYESRRAPSKRAPYQPLIVEMLTTVPVCGAWMKRLWPM